MKKALVFSLICAFFVGTAQAVPPVITDVQWLGVETETTPNVVLVSIDNFPSWGGWTMYVDVGNAGEPCVWPMEHDASWTARIPACRPNAAEPASATGVFIAAAGAGIGAPYYGKDWPGDLEWTEFPCQGKIWFDTPGGTTNKFTFDLDPNCNTNYGGPYGLPHPAHANEPAEPNYVISQVAWLGPPEGEQNWQNTFVGIFAHDVNYVFGFPSPWNTWPVWRLIIDDKEYVFGDDNPPPSGMPGDPWAVKPAGDPWGQFTCALWVGDNNPWLTGVSDTYFPCFGTMIMWTPDQGWSNSIKYDMRPYGCKTMARSDPNIAWNPYPEDNGTGVPLDVTLSWSPGDNAALHTVYMGTSEDDVNVATATPVAGPQAGLTYKPTGNLLIETPYYWRIVEVNATHPDTPWPGEVWTFTTANYNTIDDFEAYNDTTNLIKNTWIHSGANPDDVFLETMDANFIHEGDQSMGFNYATKFPPYKKEATRTFTSTVDFKADGTRALQLYVIGKIGNCDQPMYVRLEDSAASGSDSAEISFQPNMGSEQWQMFEFALSDFTAKNANLNLDVIQKITVGAGDGSDPGGDCSGTMHIDDIRLVRPRCIPELSSPADLTGDCRVNFDDLQIMVDDWLANDYTEYPTMTEPCAAKLVAHWQMNENGGTTVGDSTANNYDGKLTGDPNNPTWTTDSHEGVSALDFDGIDDYVDVNQVMGTFPNGVSYSLWVKADSFPAAMCALMHDNAWSTGAIHFFVDRRTSTTGQVNMAINGSNGTRVFYVNHDVVPMSGDHITSFGEWYHIVVTYDGDNAWVGPTQIGGCTWYGADRWWDGVIDDFRVYSYALSQEEVNWLYGEASIYHPVPSKANLYDGEPANSRFVNFRDHAVIAEDWLKEVLWPAD